LQAVRFSDTYRAYTFKKCGVLTGRIDTGVLKDLALVLLLALLVLIPVLPAVVQAACLGGGGSGLSMPATTSLRSYHAGLHAPARLALDAADNLYITDPQRGVVVIRAADGRLLRRVEGLGNPVSIAVADDGTVYLGDGEAGRVTAYDVDWNPGIEFGSGAGEFLYPSDLSIDTVSGNVYVVDSQFDLVRVYHADGTSAFSFGSNGLGDGQFRGAVAVHVNGDEVLVTDQLNFRIQFFTLEGTYKHCIGTPSVSGGFGFQPKYTRQFNFPQGLWVDAAQRIFVTDTQFGQLRVVDRNGDNVGVLGSYGRETGQLRIPTDLAIDSYGRLFVSSANNGRIEVYGLGDFTDPEQVVPGQLRLEPGVFARDEATGEAIGYVEIPGYQLADVDAGSVALNGVPAHETGIADSDNDAVAELRIVVDQAALVATLPTGTGTVFATGLLGTLTFEASASAQVTGTDECNFLPPASERGIERGRLRDDDRFLRGNRAAALQRPDLFCDGGKK